MPEAAEEAEGEEGASPSKAKPPKGAKPGHAPSAYNLFFKAKLAEIKAAEPTIEHKAAFGQAVAAWKLASPEEKAPFEAEAAEAAAAAAAAAAVAAAGEEPPKPSGGASGGELWPVAVAGLGGGDGVDSMMAPVAVLCVGGDAVRGRDGDPRDGDPRNGGLRDGDTRDGDTASSPSCFSGVTRTSALGVVECSTFDAGTSEVDLWRSDPPPPGGMLDELLPTRAYP